jgi:hypothetical protein
MLRRVLMMGVLMGGLPGILAAADPKGASKKEGVTVLRSKIADGKPTCGAACRVDFNQELGLSLDYLNTIGQRISSARSAPDPVELALAAQALSVAEQISGKKATVTSAQIQAEALDLGKMRGVSTELAALALITPDAATRQDLEKRIADARKREAEARAKTESGEQSKELEGTLTVINHSGKGLRIFASGQFVGYVPPGYTYNFYVDDHNQTTHFDAYCAQGGELVRHAHLFGHHHRATWHID